MAVTITVAKLVAALCLTDSAEETAEVTRLLEYATEAVGKYAPKAPDTAHNEAVRRVVGYLHDQPEASMGDAYANALRSSGAARALLPYPVSIGRAIPTLRRSHRRKGRALEPPATLSRTFRCPTRS